MLFRSGDKVGGGLQIQRGFADGLEQQHREQKEVHQCVHLLPHGAVERGIAAHQKAAQDEGEVGE